MVSAGSRGLNGLHDCMGSQSYQGPQDTYGSNGHIAAVMAAVAALTGNPVPLDTTQQQKQYQLMQLQAAAQQFQTLQNAAIFQHQHSQQQAAAAALIAAAAQQQQQQQLPLLRYSSRPPPGIASPPVAPPVVNPMASTPMPLAAAGVLPYMSLTKEDYEDGEQFSDESEELDDAKSRCLPRGGGGGGGGSGSAANGGGSSLNPTTSTRNIRGSSSQGGPSAGTSEKEAVVDRGSSIEPTEVSRMLVDVVSGTEKGCQVWMEPIPSDTRKDVPGGGKKRKASAGDGSNGSSSGGSGGSDTMVDLNGHGGKRMRLLWTPELHGRFLHAVNQLGVSNAVPKTILLMMNVGGMTRENVASHLQKYRLYLKRLAGLPPSAPLRTSDTLRQLQTAQQVAAAAGGSRLDTNAAMPAPLTTAELISQLEAMNAGSHGHAHSPRHHVSNSAATAAAALAAASLLPVVRPSVPPTGTVLNLSAPTCVDMASAFAPPANSLALPRGPGRYEAGGPLANGYPALTGGVNGVNLMGGSARPLMRLG